MESDSESDQTAVVRPGKWRRIRRIAYCATGLAVGVPLIAFWIAYLLLDVRSPQDVLASLDKTVVLKYADGSDLLRIVPAGGDRRFVPFDQVPAKLRDAIVATEDPTFWDNAGFDPTGIGRAFLTGVGGGSGITQQYIKKSTGDEDSTLSRKMQELVLATKITQQQSKEQIFESYVNIISFGRNTFGPAAAMNAFFGRPLDDSITWSEAAFLAGMIQSPSVHDPAVSGDEHAAKRWRYVRDKLVERGYLKNADGMAYPGAEIKPPAETRVSVNYDQYHLKQQALAELEEAGFPLSRLQQGNLTVQTTLDPKLQAAAHASLDDRLKAAPAEFRGALVAIDPASGAVRAYDGGNNGVRDYAGTGHPLGSAFHPFTAAAGLASGMRLTDRLDEPARIEYLGEKFEYPAKCPQPCTVRSALASGATTPFISLARKVGVDAVSAAARSAGIPDEVDSTPTMREKDGVTIGSGIVVGRYPLRPLDVASAYATFAADGRHAPAHLVDKVLDQSGKVVWQYEKEPTATVAPEVARDVTEALRTTLPDGGSAALRTGESERGNSQDNQDAWAVGYTEKLAASVWIGTDDDRKLVDGDGTKVTGSGLPAEIWRSFLVQR
ncbi:transglycosylase domain-containing protein [Amycolatopsis benzoatilytica]|uniref:transglycosylase domain-containing protein n=1 Tax=Amycolatopsis benzoatilytica TaxID=346045 RepID=UPI0003731D07|nr:transglycosylase domain-containing protein [Amycolatopsis benzoatilytica]